MYILFLVTSFIATTLSLLLQWQTRIGLYTAVRLAFIQSLILHGIAVFIYNESFSLFSLITPLTARLYWFSVAMISCGWLFRSLRKGADFQLLLRSLRNLFTFSAIDQRSRFLIYGGVLLLILPLLVLAIYAPPNNFDSNHYHLNRVLCWLFNQNVEYHPTMYIQQLYLNLFAEYLVLHTILLVGSDQLANIIQFGAMLGSVAAVSLLAKWIGLSYRGQLLAGILLVCLPIGLFESTTTQVDYVACFLFISFVQFMYRFLVDSDRFTLFWALLALVFGSFSKYPVMFFALPYVVYLSIHILRKQGIRYGAYVLIGAMVLYGVVFGLFFIRNYSLFGSVLSPKVTSRLLNDIIPTEKHSVAYSTSNLIKNVGLHLSTPFMPINYKVESAINGLHRLLKVPIDEPTISKDHFHVRFSMEEDSAPNTFHFLLLLAAVLFLFFRRGHSEVKLLFGLSVVGLILYCTFFKFQWFNTRIHMQFFTVGCVIIAYVWNAILKRTGFYLALVLYLLSMTIVFGNPNKMVIPFRYVVKRTLAHIPRYLGATSPSQRQQYSQTVGTYYQPSPFNDCPYCMELRQPDYSYSERSEIFQKLDSINFFKHDKEESILYETRTQAYFASHTADYNAYAPLLTHIGSDVQSIGFLPSANLGFYHYWSALSLKTDNPVKMSYIRYPHEYVNLPNAKKQFCYTHILSDKAELVRRLVTQADIAEIHTSDGLTLVRLKQPSCKRYLF